MPTPTEVTFPTFLLVPTFLVKQQKGITVYDQNWHVVYGPKDNGGDVGGDYQATEAWITVLRMDNKTESSPGPEIVIYTYGEYLELVSEVPEESQNLQVTTQVSYEIREDNGDVNEADMEYRLEADSLYRTENSAFIAARHVAEGYAGNADRYFDWNGKSATHRAGGYVNA